MPMKFKTRDTRTVLSTKVSTVFKNEIKSIAKNEGVKPSNVLLTFAVEGYKKYCLENKLSQPQCWELEE